MACGSHARRNLAGFGHAVFVERLSLNVRHARIMQEMAEDCTEKHGTIWTTPFTGGLAS